MDTKTNKRPKTYPFSIRLTQEERRELERLAAGQPLGVFARARLLGAKLAGHRSRGKTPVKDHQSLAQVLAKLGQSRIANNLNQLARAVNAGVLTLSPETEALIREACQAILDIKRMLMAALGIQER